jgi:hypothetical protein
MIIALLALALAMILGGFLAIFFGWDMVLIERGWTMVLAGSISAASGALLLGITAAVSRLAQIQDELVRLQGGFQGGLPDDLRAGLPVQTPAMPQPPVEPLSVAALSGGVLSGAAADKAEAAEERASPAEPLLPFPDQDRLPDDKAEETAPKELSDRHDAEPADAVVPFRARSYPDPAASDEPDALEAKVPDFLLGDRFRDDEEPRASEALPPLPEPAAEEPEDKPDEELPETAPARDEGVTPAAWPDVDLVEPEVPEQPEESREPRIDQETRPVEETREAHEHEVPEEREAASGEGRAATVVGTYNSGDNRYVMFSDGSIEAHTPSGVFRFKSLDELKEFIASGGEGGSTAA